MKKIIVFAVILGVLTGGIIFYTMRKAEEESAIIAPKVLPAAISVEQGHWKDMLVPDKEPGRIHRQANNDAASILDLTDDTIVIDWDNWGIETFKKDQNNIWKRVDNASK